MRLIQAVLFDLDGTLANTLVSIASFANEALADCCLPAIETDAYRYLVGNGRDTLIRRMLHTLGQPEDGDLFGRVGAAYDAAYAAEPLRLVTAYPHIPQLLEGLKDRGIPCAVLSNKPDDMTHAVVGGLFARDTFAVVRRPARRRTEKTRARRRLFDPQHAGCGTSALPVCRRHQSGHADRQKRGCRHGRGVVGIPRRGRTARKRRRSHRRRSARAAQARRRLIMEPGGVPRQTERAKGR